MSGMPFTTLIDTSALAEFLGDEAVLIADCGFDLKDPPAGERAYAAAHIPGAVYVHLGRDLAGPKTGTNGRHPLPDPATAAQTFGRLGIGAGTQVIAYDQDSGMYASRLWWMLRWLGHDEAAVLDGGFAKWLAEGRPTTSGSETRATRVFQAAVRPHMLATVEELNDRAAEGWRLVDARAPERYRGDIEPIDRVPGHIPGAVNHFYQWNLNEEGTFRAGPDLAERLKASVGGAPADRTITYCGSGVTACHNLLALERAGLHGGKLYAGSWSEWSADPARQVERSAE